MNNSTFCYFVVLTKLTVKFVENSIKMDYYFEVCIKPKSKYEHFKSVILKELDECKQVKLTIENPYIKNVGKAFCEYIIEHNKKLGSLPR